MTRPCPVLLAWRSLPSTETEKEKKEKSMSQCPINASLSTVPKTSRGEKNEGRLSVLWYIVTQYGSTHESVQRSLVLYFGDSRRRGIACFHLLFHVCNDMVQSRNLVCKCLDFLL